MMPHAMTSCPNCCGRGYFRDHEDQWSCSKCLGTGVFEDEAPVTVHETLRAANTHRQVLWNGGEHKSNGSLYAAVELAGEVGELCNIVKKLERESRNLPGTRATRKMLEDEIGDVQICLDLLAMEYGVDVAAVTARKFNKTSRKLDFPVRMKVDPLDEAQ